jgi:hypothetical protein
MDGARGGRLETGSPTWKHSLLIRCLRVHGSREKRLSDEIEGYLIDEGRQKGKRLEEHQIDRFS